MPIHDPAPSVAFLIAAYNAEATIARSLTSALEQTYRGDVRIVVVNDGSTDATAKIVRQFDQVDLIDIDKNVGRAAARNIGLRAIDTEWVAIQDADDTSYPMRLEYTIDQRGDAAVVGAHVAYYDPVQGLVEGVAWPSGDHQFSKQQLLRGKMPFPHPTAVMSLDAVLEVGGYREDFAAAEDLELMIRLARIVDFKVLPMCVAEYRRPRVDRFSYLHEAERWRRRAMVVNGLVPPRCPPTVLAATERARSTARRVRKFKW